MTEETNKDEIRKQILEGIGQHRYFTFMGFFVPHRFVQHDITSDICIFRQVGGKKMFAMNVFKIPELLVPVLYEGGKGKEIKESENDIQ